MKKIKIFLSATSGGHLTEGIELFSNLSDVQLIFLSEDCVRTRNMPDFYTYKKLWNSSIGAIAGSFFKSLKIIMKERPQWVVSTGAECGIGSLIAGKLTGRKTIFVETVTRYKSKTKSAKIAYYFVNHFYVQHEEGLALFGNKAEYIGGLF